MKKCTSFEEQKSTRYIRGNVYFGLIVFSCFWSTKPCLKFLLICFAREIKGFYQTSLGNKLDIWDMNVSQISRNRFCYLLPTSLWSYLSFFVSPAFSLKSDSHVPENFCQFKIFLSFVLKSTIVCLLFKNENKLILKLQILYA